MRPRRANRLPPRRWRSRSQAATAAALIAIERAGIPKDRIGVLINTSVCRDYIEPSTACLVHGNLELGRSCLNFDLGNACLGASAGR